jgi:hypothetical protein
LTSRSPSPFRSQSTLCGGHAEPIGYTWSYLAWRIGHLVPVWQPLMGSSFQQWRIQGIPILAMNGRRAPTLESVTSLKLEKKCGNFVEKTRSAKSRAKTIEKNISQVERAASQRSIFRMLQYIVKALPPARSPPSPVGGLPFHSTLHRAAQCQTLHRPQRSTSFAPSNGSHLHCQAPLCQLLHQPLQALSRSKKRVSQ